MAEPYLARVWELGVPTEVYRRREHGLTVEIVTPEGHVAQMIVTAQGEVLVRAWLHDDLYLNGGENRTVFTASGQLADARQMTTAETERSSTRLGDSNPPPTAHLRTDAE